MPSDRRLEREAAKRRRHRRGQAIAALSSLVVLGGLAALILTSPGWPEVRETFFNREVFESSFPDVARAFWLDVKIFVVAELAILVVGQFSAPGGDTWGALLEKDSPLTECVSKAISDLRESGDLDQITEKWMGAETASELN